MQFPTKSPFEPASGFTPDLRQSGGSPVFDVEEEIPGYGEVHERVTLHFALEQNNSWNVIRLIENPEVDLNSKNKEGLTPLIFSVMYKEFEITEILLSSKRGSIEIDAQDSSGKTALACAAVKNKIPALNALLAKGAKCEIADVCGDTPLTWASRLGHSSVLESLLSHENSNPNLMVLMNSKNSEGRTPLMLAVEGLHIEAVSLLLEAGASTDIAGPGGVSLLDLALSSNNAPLIELVAQAVIPNGVSDANCTLDIVDKRAIKQAIKMDKWDGLLALSKFGFRLYDDIKKDILKRRVPESISHRYLQSNEDPFDVRLEINPLILALDLNLTLAAEILATQNPESVCRDNGLYETPIMLACKLGNVGLVNQFLNQGASLNTLNFKAESCAHYAAEFGQIEVLNHLAGLVEDKHRDLFIWQCVKGAIRHEDSAVLDYVIREFVLAGLKAGKTITGFNVVSGQGYTALIFAVAFNRIDAVRLLAGFGDELGFSNEIWEESFVLASKKGSVEILTVLLEAISDYGFINQALLEKAILAAIRAEQWNALKLLSKSAPSIGDEVFQCFVERAVCKEHLEILYNRLDRDFYPNEINKYLADSVRAGYVDVVKYFLDKGGELSFALSEFVAAAGFGHHDMVNFLIEGASREQLQSALMSAVKGGHSTIVDVLRSKGASVEAALPLLAEVAGKGHVEMVAMLINFDVSRQERESAMLKAAQNGKSNVVLFLKENEVDLSCIKSTFKEAVSFNHSEIVEILIESDLADGNFEEYLLTAARKGYGEIVRMLLGRVTDNWAIGEALVEAAADGDAKTIALILGNETWRKNFDAAQAERALKIAAEGSYDEKRAGVVAPLLELAPSKEFVLDVYWKMKRTYDDTVASEQLKTLKATMKVLVSYLGFSTGSTS